MSTEVVGTIKPVKDVIMGVEAVDVVVSDEVKDIIKKAEARGKTYKVQADGSVVVFRKNGEPDLRFGKRHTTPDAPHGYTASGQVRKKPGRK